MAVAVIVVLTASLLATGAAVAQSDRPPDVRLTVTALTQTVGPGTRVDDVEPPAGADDLRVRVLVENEGTEPVEDLTLSVEVFDGATSRSELHRALDDGGRPARLLESRFEDVAGGGALDPGDVAAVSLTVEASRIGWGDRTGVHPVAIAVLSGRAPLDAVTTAVVALGQEPERPLPTVIGWPLDAPPRRSIDDRFDTDTVEAVQPGGRLERLVWTLEQHPDVPVQVLSSAHVAEDLLAMRDGFTLVAGDREVPVSSDDRRARAAGDLLERLRAVVSGRATPLVASPYGDAQLAALQTGGFTLDAIRAVVDGRARFDGALGERPSDDSLWATTTLDPATLREVLGPAGVERVLLGWDQLASGDGPPARTPPPLHILRAGGVQVTAAVADPWLQDLLGSLPDEHGPTVAVQRILAETAQAHLEQPGASQGRGVVLLPPPDWSPSPRIAEALLAGLVRAPWLSPLGVDELEDAYGSTPDRSQLDPSSVEMPTELRDRLARTTARLAALQDAATDQVEEIGGYTWSEIGSALQRTPSGWWLDDRTSPADALLTDLADVLDRGFGVVRLPPDARITLTDTEGRIPVTVSRPEGPPIRVIVELDAPKLDLPEDARLVTLSEGGQQTISFPAVAQASGRIPVTVRVKTPGAIDPAGSPWFELATETMVVQSTVFSGTALLILGGILVLLLGWWLYRRWRPPSPQLTVVRDEAA